MLKSKKIKITALSVSAVVLVFAIVLITSITKNHDEIIYDVPETTRFAELTVTESPKPNVIRRHPSITTSQTTSTENDSETEPPAIEVTLAPVEIPDERVFVILEEHDVQVVDNPPIVQEVPAPEEQQPPDSVTYIDGQIYVWHPIFGWCPGGDGTVIIMDVESNGEMYEGGW